LQVTGGGCRCSGMLEVKWEGTWSRVCQGSVSEVGICQRLGCGPRILGPLQLVLTGTAGSRLRSLRCPQPVGDPSRCHWVPANCTHHVAIACREPVKTTPEPPTERPVTTPEPPGPARLRLVNGNFSCSGFLELHKEGLWGAVAANPGIWAELATGICQHLRCGAAIPGRATPEPGSHLPVRWEVVEPPGGCSLFDCFNRTGARRGRAPAFLICSGSQPRARRRLGAGPTPCEGDIEIFLQGGWRVLCDEREQRAERGRQLCRELRCGNVSSSTESRHPPADGVACRVPSLHLCSDSRHLSSPQGQDSKPRPPGTAAGTIVSICLALLLFGLLLLICGPPTYRRLMKRISRKKQRQWIGPTGLNQTVSFHRNSTVSSRQRLEGQRGGGGDNDYAQPPQKGSQLSAYPALEGAGRASNPPDNSSDSDYDLQCARRL
ncbi:CD5 protein, partial [Alcedo cyanopectus]|nr:CD5 protein [Ceyx cyanopectus]